MIATDVELKNNIDHYIAVMKDGSEITLTDANGKKIGKFVPENDYDEETVQQKPKRSFDEIMRSLSGILKGDEDYKIVKDKYLREKYDIND